MSKRKSLQLDQSTKKLKIDLPEETTSSKTKSNPFQGINWSNEDILDLLTKIEKTIPKDDNLSYSSRLEKFDWENVQVKSHSVKDCRKIFNTLYRQVRKYRLLQEVVSDMKELTKNLRLTPKPPSKPKKPPNSYLLFLEENRYKFAKENPTVHPREIAKILGQKFKSLSSQEKEKYEKESKKLQENYTISLQKFYNEHPELIPKKQSKNAKPIEFADGMGPPKKPKTPFDLFVEVEIEKEECGESKFVITQKCREIWNNFTDKEKFFWINWADELHKKYIEELKEYLKKHPTYKPECLKSLLNKNEKIIKERCCGKPDKPPRTPYHLFSKMILESEEFKQIDSKNSMNYIAERWRNCPQDEKDTYKIRLKQMWDDFSQQFEQYLMTLPPEDRDRIRSEETIQFKNNKQTPKTTKPEAVPKITKPICPPSTPHKYFLKTYKGDGDPNLIWKKLKQNEKDKYEEELNKEKTKYITLYETYLKSLSREELEKFATQTNQYSSSSDSDSDDTDN